MAHTTRKEALDVRRDEYGRAWAVIAQRPLVGVTVWRRPLPTYLGDRTDLYTLGPEYVAPLHDEGLDVVLLPHPSNARAMASRLDGLVLAGGEDVHPVRSAASPQPGQQYDVERDANDVALFHEAKRRGLPVLAICRGMQIAAVAGERRLVQELPATSEHPRVSGAEAILALRHPIAVEPGTRLAELLGAGEHTVNSIHHQAVEQPPAGFRVAARAADGVLEAIESTDPSWFCLCLQWHPEKLTAAAERRQQRPIFAAFADACRAAADHHHPHHD